MATWLPPLVLLSSIIFYLFNKNSSWSFNPFGDVQNRYLARSFFRSRIPFTGIPPLGVNPRRSSSSPGRRAVPRRRLRCPNPTITTVASPSVVPRHTSSVVAVRAPSSPTRTSVQRCLARPTATPRDPPPLHASSTRFTLHLLNSNDHLCQVRRRQRTLLRRPQDRLRTASNASDSRTRAGARQSSGGAHISSASVS